MDVPRAARTSLARGAVARRLALGLLAGLGLAVGLSSGAARHAHASAASPGRVVLVHGLARGAGSMSSLAGALRGAGYSVDNFDYPSTEMEPEKLVSLLADEVRRCCAARPERLHFVTHSLGGILVRALLEGDRPPNLGRVVMLAPPNQGSEIVDSLGDSALFEAALGPTAVRLGTDPQSFPNSIGPPDYEVGIVAGSESINPLGSALLPGPDDGAVALARTKLEGATDFVLVDASHTFIMRDDVAIAQVLHFLRSGSFLHDTPRAEESGPAESEPARTGGAR